MRTISGYILICTLFTIFITVLFGASSEVQKVQGFNKALNQAVNEDKLNIKKTSLLLDANGQVFSEMNRPFRLYVENEDIPSFAKDLLVITEDRNFYEHVGFDAGAIIRALVKNLVFTHIQQGGSTITQQLARNLYLGQEKTYNRKLTELFYSYEIEKSFSKDEIMELYLNVIYFSNGIYGVETASQYYFNQNLQDLNKAELSFILAIPNNPNKYDPLEHFDKAKERQERLLDLLEQEGTITAQESKKIKNTPIKLKIRKKIDQYPDYAVYAEHELSQLIAHSEGFDKKIKQANTQEEKLKMEHQLDKRVNEVVQSGIMIHTALQPSMQQKSIEALNNSLVYEGVEGATVTINNKSRKIVAITGGKHYQKYNFHHAYQAVRQPGSVIKPLLVYGPYIEEYQPSIYETINANSYCVSNYCPENYGGRQYGQVTINQAFKESYNTPALRLFEKTGITKAFETLNLFDFENVQLKDQTYAAAVGGFTYGMSPLELTDAYTSFVNGSYLKSHAIIKVTDRKGKVLYEWKDPSIQVWSPQTTEKMRKMLNFAAVTGTGEPAYVSKPYVGIKTGTTNNYNDYWVMGLTDQYTTGVWVGHDIPKSMEAIERYRPSHRIWKWIMK
ncbi:penicillin-binding protein 1A [Bacillus pakistanensis]|uniref:Penicillin-binding protein 1A n=1 Tax=Rossellomorea pakistanensis TaxID=992288 RepID=A0ABS2NEH0_9BACI|nr:transglycosylase domain-containing protein [Bacillus pakistanensis]MBM7586250.1 penicillin-binding protein 1A [Bacillus pakistanensis]